jgi:hypothetical protein
MVLLTLFWPYTRHGVAALCMQAQKKQKVAGSEAVVPARTGLVLPPPF